MANMKTLTSDLHNFTRIDMRGTGNVHLTQGKDFSFEMTAEETIIELIETFVEDQTLIIQFKENTRHVRTDEDITYAITMPIIGEVQISGGGSLDCERIAGKNFRLSLPGGSNVKIGSIAVVDFDLSVQGGAKVAINSVQAANVAMRVPGSLNMTIGQLNADHLDVSVKGTVNTQLAGRVVSQTLNVLGVVNIKAGQLQSDHTSVKSLGMSNITVWAHDTLDATISGAGNIKYYGNPSVKKSISGFGKVKQIGKSPAKIV